MDCGGISTDLAILKTFITFWCQQKGEVQFLHKALIFKGFHDSLVCIYAKKMFSGYMQGEVIRTFTKLLVFASFGLKVLGFLNIRSFRLLQKVVSQSFGTKSSINILKLHLLCSIIASALMSFEQIEYKFIVLVSFSP